MKKYSKILRAAGGLLLLAIPVILFSCSGSGSEPETAKDKTLKLLSSEQWHISTVKADDVDKTNSFTGFTLSFSKGTFTASNGDPVWPASGTWDFTNDDARAFIRDDDAVVTIESISSTSLKLTMEWSTDVLNGGRMNSVNGQYVFEFQP
jgi:hypothetical protein